MQSKNVEHIDVKAFVKTWLDGKYLEKIAPTAQLAKFKEEFEELAQRTKQDCEGGKMEDKIKEKANKMRSMSDKELVAYVENRVEKARSEGFNQGFKLRQEVESDLSDLVIGLENLIKSIYTTLKYNHYNHLLGYVNSLYDITAKLHRRDI
jgi:hypothetical protein